MCSSPSGGLDRHALAGPFENGPGVIDPPVAVGGVVVVPGDLIVTDSDGVVVVPHHRAGWAADQVDRNAVHRLQAAEGYQVGEVGHPGQARPHAGVAGTARRTVRPWQSSRFPAGPPAPDSRSAGSRRGRREHPADLEPPGLVEDAMSPLPLSAVKLHVTVQDLACVQRVLTLLTGRAYPLTRFEAEEAGAGRWRLSIDTVADADGAELLEARLLRLPSVLTVDLDRSAVLAVAG